MATRVLVVDDEPDISNVIKKGLESSGYMVDAFNDPEDGLSCELVNRGCIILIVLKPFSW
jgi:DNA-binding response OmpR family regulator